MRDNKKITYLLLGLIVVLAAFLRLYKLDQVPPSLSWDEAAVGYNAYTIANWGQDEWGKSWPFYFKSFEDDKSPIHVYLTAISVKLLGLNEFSTRLPMAILGVFSVSLLFFLAKLLFKSNLVGLLAAAFLTISPYALQFSRFNHEATVALFFFMLGLLLFFKSLSGRKQLLPLSYLSFGISILSYHSAKIVVPPMIVILSTLYFKDLYKIKTQFILGNMILAIFALIILLNPALLGFARMKQASIPADVIYQTTFYKSTGSEVLGRLEIGLERYLSYFSPGYLFITGAEIARFSTQEVGEFYKVDALFLIVGLIGIIKLRSKVSIIILSWALLAPIPAAFAGGLSETGHAARALFTMGSWHLVTAFGFYKLINLFKIKYLKVVALGVGIFLLAWQFRDYINYYYGDYSKRYAIDWQYGMKQMVEFIKDRNGYFQVYTTDIRFQPYIFFLYYLKTPLPEFLASVKYNNNQFRNRNLVSAFDKYHFGDWNPIKSQPDNGILYIVTPDQYDGLESKKIFDVKQRIYYLNGTDAFFLVSYP